MRLPVWLNAGLSRATGACLWRLVLVAALAAGVAGCNGPGQPRRRVGALPFPGLFTLYTTADPEHLGHHRSGGLPPPFGKDGADRGIIYTTQAGFLDLAHIRDTIDWTHYWAGHVRTALRQGNESLSLASMDRTWFHLRFHYPADWSRLSEGERGTLTGTLSIRVGEQLGYLTLTWHEVLTWHGYKATLIFDESRSAFTYDDILSHIVGSRVARAAMERVGTDDREAFDAAVTEELLKELRSLGAVGPNQTDRAVELVEGDWWANGKPLKRQVSDGIPWGHVRPWLVAEMSKGVEAREFEVPVLGYIHGRDFRGFYEVEIESRASQTDRIVRAVPAEHRKRLVPTRDLPLVLAQIRTELGEDDAVTVAAEIRGDGGSR